MAASESTEILTDVHSVTVIHWVGILLSVGLATINIYIGYVTGESPFLVVGFGFLVGVGLFFTRFWQPIFYLFAVLYIATLGVLWLLSGMQLFTLGVVTGVLSIGLGGIAFYLFYEAETAVQT